jgi:hypothetical protein
VHFNGEKRKTEVKERCSNPIFYDTIDLRRQVSTDHSIAQQVVTAQVFDHDGKAVSGQPPARRPLPPLAAERGERMHTFIIVREARLLVLTAICLPLGKSGYCLLHS